MTKEEILEVVSDYYNLDKADLLRHTRLAKFVEARYVAMYFMRHFGHTLQSIGDMFSRKFQLVIYGVRYVTERLETDKELDKTITELERLLNK